MYTGGPIEELTAQKIRDFIEDFRNDKLELVFKSEDVPEKVTGPKEVRKIVGKSWASEVLDSTKDVFVAFTSNHCRACRDLDQIWKEVAEQTPDDIIIARFDLDANELKDLVRQK